VGPEVERDAWVDQPSLVSGSGQTEFVSDAPSGYSRSGAPGRNDRVAEPSPAPAVIEGGYIYLLSGFAGLVVVDATDPAALRAEGRYPFQGQPYSISVEGGIAFAIMRPARSLPCDGEVGCADVDQSRVLLIDATDPAAPTLLAERSVPGVVTHTWRDGDVLYVVSRELAPCYECFLVPERRAVVSALDLGDPRALGDLGRLELPVSGASASRAYGFADGRLFVATSNEAVQVVELGAPPRLGASAPFPGWVSQSRPLSVDGGVLRVPAPRDAPSSLEFALSAAGELTPIEPVLFPGPRDEPLEPSFDGNRAYALSADGQSLSTFDVSERRAPRRLATLELAQPASGLAVAAPGQIVAYGSLRLAQRQGPVGVSSIDVSDPLSPRVVSEVTVPNSDGLYQALRFDPSAGTLTLQYWTPYAGSDTELRMQIVTLTAGELALGANQLARADVELLSSVEGVLVADGRVVRSDNEGLATFSVAAGSDLLALAITQPADAVRAVSRGLVGFDTLAPSARILPSTDSDPLTAVGTAVASSLTERGIWQERVLAWGEQIYLARGTFDPPVALDLRGVDISEPSAPVPTGGVVLAASDGEAYLRAMQTSRSVVVPAVRPGDSPFRVTPASGSYPGSSVRFDVIDVQAPAEPRLASSIEVPAALAEGGFLRGVLDTTVDAPWGWQTMTASGLVSGELLVSDHSEEAERGRRRFFLDRLDLSDPSAPRWLPPVNVPGSVLAFDAGSGWLVTLETLIFEERAQTWAECAERGYGSVYDVMRRACRVVRRALNALSLEAEPGHDGDVATLQSRLILDDTRRALLFAVAGDQVFYVTEPLLDDAAIAAAEADGTLTVTLERLRVRGGQFERLPSLDISALHARAPRAWGRFVARGNRVVSLVDDTLGVVDFDSEQPRVREVRLPRGCPEFDLSGDTLYCAGGDAGLVAVALPR
jgi:hypothetical protein